MYNAIFEYLKNRAPGLLVNLQFAMMDYERALISSTRSNFPNVCIRGCWFHFTRVSLLFKIHSNEDITYS